LKQSVVPVDSKKNHHPAEDVEDVSDVEFNPKTGANFFELNLRPENLQGIINTFKR
jgi:hypothetical protein